VSDPSDQFDAVNPFAAPQANDLLPPPASGDEEGLPFQPFRTIWTAPRRTIRQIVRRNRYLHVIPLLCLGGVAQALERAAKRNVGDSIGPQTLFLIIVFLSPLGGLFGGWLVALLLRVSGGWIGGRADFTRLQAAVAWSSLPKIVGLALWLPLIALLGMQAFTSVQFQLESAPTLVGVMLAMSVALLVLSIWGFVLLCNTVAEVQGFRSAWAGLGNVLLAVLLLIVPLIAIVMMAVGIGVITS
jgi:hypothetical protein